MSKNDFHEELDHLAIKIEQKIKKGDKILKNTPDFSPRSVRSKKMRKTLNDK